MPSDDRELLAVLKAELTFLAKGGYRNGPGGRPRQKFVFEDSPTCLNFGRTKDPRPCCECVMTSLVPADCLGEQFPCRHIPLNVAGFTVDTYYRLGTFEEAEAATRTWLQKIIANLEALAPAQNRSNI
jgi:hypothetical protein